MKKKRSLAFSLGALALVLTLITSSLTSGTLAKYTSSTSTAANAVVAAWNFKAGTADTQGNITEFVKDVQIKLGDSKYRSASVKANTVANGKIAPGTSGSVPFAFDITGTEVAVDVSFEVKLNTDSTDIQIYPAGILFTFTGDGITPNSKSIEDLEGGETFVFTKRYTVSDIAAMSSVVKVNLDYAWTFETGADQTTKDTNNLADTLTGIDAANDIENIVLDIKVTGTQVAPTTSVPTT